jgi:hypothetical protein
MPARHGRYLDAFAQRAVGRVVIAGSSIESVVANIAARLLPDPAKGIERFAGRPSSKCSTNVEGSQIGDYRLNPATTSLWLACKATCSAGSNVPRKRQSGKTRLCTATWLRVDKPLPSTVAYLHFGVDSRASDSALVQQVAIVDLDQMAVEMESVVSSGLLLRGLVDDFLNVST